MHLVAVPGCSGYLTTPDTFQVRQICVGLRVSLGDRHFTRVAIRKLFIDYLDPGRLCDVCLTPMPLMLWRGLTLDFPLLCRLSNMWLLGALVFLVGGFSLINKYGKFCGVTPFPSSPHFVQPVLVTGNPQMLT